jgi:Protein of unknown function (DUF1553)/Protein of unknown function (DUF1549)/Bacterial Ig-like domain (group 2)
MRRDVHAGERHRGCRGRCKRFLPVALMPALLVAGLISQRSAGASETTRSEPTALRIVPPSALLRGPDSVQQLAVDGLCSGGEPRDLTRSATFQSSDQRVATVDGSGLITAQSDGKATITVRVGALTVAAPVTVQDFAAGLPVNFANQVVPIFTKLGCNAGGCHGKASGQNGFRLSLLGFEPAVDYETVVKEARGRRVFPAAPEASLLLQKATAKVPHGGGKRLDPDSHEYRLIRRWIGLGMPIGKPTDPTVERISVYPADRVLPRGSSQQIVVTAHYSDGRSEDVTRWAQYQTNDSEVATVEVGGRVDTPRLAGLAAIMARYQGQVAVFRATVPSGTAGSSHQEFVPASAIDVAIAEQWKALAIAPSPSCTDADFIRRASLHITGTLPTPIEVRSFIADPAADKRAKLIDRLLAQPEYASFFAIKWADILRNKREGKPEIQYATFNFFDWIQQKLASNTPYDQFVRAILTASGPPRVSPQVQWYRKLQDTSAFVDDTAQVFLGMRLQCAKCHHHPFEKWAQDDYYGFAAFFARVGRKPDAQAVRNGREGEAVYLLRAGTVTHPKTGQVMAPRGLGAKPVQVSAEEDPRQKLVDWMTGPENPFFARALVNRYWAHFFGRGIVEPLDDVRLTNPPSNPALLDRLADSFVKSGYDLKALIRTICTSRVYGLSSVPNDSNARDRQSFARRYPQRMNAEVLLDAIARVSDVPTSFDGLPAGTRAIELPDESVGSTFLDAFGRPKRDTPCECERVTDASLSQSLMLLNSNDVQTQLAAPAGRAERLAKAAGPDSEKIAELFWMAFARGPTQRELESALAHLANHRGNTKGAYEDIIWALINAKEFQFIN